MRYFRKMDRYVISYFFSSYTICFTFFLGLFVVVDLVPKVDNLMDAAPLVRHRGESLFWTAIAFYLYKIPEIFMLVAPYLTVMSAMFCVTRLKKNNELTPMIMAGVSIFRILTPIFVVAGILMLCMVTIQEILSPWCAENRMLIKAYLIDHEEKLLVEKHIFRDTTGSEIRDIVASNYNVATRVIESLDVSYVKQDAGRQMNVSIKGKNARWLGKEQSAWSLEEGVITESPITNTGVPPRTRPVKVLYTDLTPADILMKIKTNPWDMNFKEIRRAYALNPDDYSKKIFLHYHITFPLSNIILLLLGLPFVLRPESRGNILGVAIALLICGSYFVFDVIMRNLGSQGQISPVMAAWMSTVVCGAIGIYLFDSIRT